jgi:hypothetical protein
MAPVHLSILGDSPARVPVVDDPFWIGRDPGCDLCLWDLRVSRKHARVSRNDGAYLIASEGRHGVYVNGLRVEEAPLRNGDEVALTPPGETPPIRLRFENAIEGVSVPTDASISSVWVEAQRGRERKPGIVERFEVLGPLTDDGPMSARLARERATGRAVVLSVYPPVRVGAQADAWLRLLTALAGAAHPAMARVIDGGLEAVEEGAMRWMATVVARGRRASLRIPEGPQAPVTVVRRLRALAAGLHLLHSRGVVHGGVLPGHVLLRPDGTAVLVGYGRSFLRRDGGFEVPGLAPDPLYVAPEARERNGHLPSPSADLFGLAAVGWGLLAGRSPFHSIDDRAAPPVGTFATAGIDAPAVLEDVLVRAMSAEPADRPTAEDLGHALAFAEASLSAVKGDA